MRINCGFTARWRTTVNTKRHALDLGLLLMRRVRALPVDLSWNCLGSAVDTVYIRLSSRCARLVNFGITHYTFVKTTIMKLFAPIVLALAAASEAAFCIGGWGLPGGSTCPGAYVSSRPIQS